MLKKWFFDHLLCSTNCLAEFQNLIPSYNETMHVSKVKFNSSLSSDDQTA